MSKSAVIKIGDKFFVSFLNENNKNLVDGYVPFNETVAKNYINYLLNHYKIKVVSWSKSSCGRAYINRKEVKIPAPTDIDRFCVALHEIGHIVLGRSNRVYRTEYEAEKFALEHASYFYFDTREYTERARWYIVMNVSKGYCRRLNLDTIEQDVIDFCRIDFNEWKGKKVFVKRNKDYNKNQIILS